jgi:hypothetical protein
MKLHLRLGATKALSALTVITLAISVTLLGSAPVRAQAAPPVTLQCQVSTNGNGFALACNGTIPGGSGVLNCQSPNAISNNNGVFTAAPVNCSGTGVLAGITVPGTLSASVLTIDSNSGSISVSNGDGTLTIDEGLSSVTATCSGAFFSTTLSPPTLAIPNGTCTVTPGVLGIGTAQITIHGGSISATSPPNVVLTLNSPSITTSASVLGLINTSTTCGTSVAINLSQIFPITIPAPCSGL